MVEVDEGLVVYLHARPHDGQANEALVKMLAKYFGVPKTRLKIVGGLRSREKIIEVLD